MSALWAEETETEEVEDVESFRRRARAWITANLRPMTMEELRHDYSVADEETELASVAHERALQRLLFDNGFAGLCFPRAYGGQGLTPERTRRSSTRRSSGTSIPVASRCRRSRPAPR